MISLILIFLQDVNMPPPSPNLSASKGNEAKNISQPTPASKRTLDQEEFNKKLKAKRDIFAKVRTNSYIYDSRLMTSPFTIRREV